MPSTDEDIMDCTAPTRRYIGSFSWIDGERIHVHEDGHAPRLLDPRYDLQNHSPDGFAWGYEGSGPAQAALAILADALQATTVYSETIVGQTLPADAVAQRYYQDFKRAFISRFPSGKRFELSLVNVLTWFCSIHGDWTPGVTERSTCPHGGEWGRCNENNCVPF